MSILIRGMEMPQYGCDHCFLRTGNYCGRIEKDEAVVEYARKNERHPDCPLVPVPPHGRLIDADAMIREIEKSIAPSWYIKERNTDMVKFLSLEDTIIPAEEGE